MTDYFNDELAPILCSLFKDNFMRHPKKSQVRYFDCKNSRDYYYCIGRKRKLQKKVSQRNLWLNEIVIMKMQIIKICFRCWCYVTVPEIWHLTYVVFVFQNAKMAQNDKKFCLSSYSISQKLCIICSSFMVHMCKMISLGIFSFFQNLIFLVVRGGGGGKRAKNGQKLCMSHSIYQEPNMI